MLNGDEAIPLRIKAPAEDNGLVAVPHVSQLSLAPAIADITLQGKSLGSLRSDARQQLLAAAAAYTRQYRDLPRPLADRQLTKLDQGPFIVTGHQAELFHPGVWFKNVVAHRLAQQHQGIALHLVVDTDLCRHSSVLAPSGTPQEPYVQTIPYDAPGPLLPVEEHQVVDRTVFDNFPAMVQATLAPLLDQPLVTEYWPLVTDALARQDGQLGLALAQGRHALESRWGLDTLELPLSACCQVPAFYWFAAHLLANSDQVRTSYNKALAAYRQTHHLRSLAQPLPDLRTDGDWSETPFWTWTISHPERAPLFARATAEGVELSDRHGWQTLLDLSADRSAEIATQQLLELAAAGRKIRTRALTTTLFARLLVSDLFLHGIGGAKYDLVTNDWANRLWGITLPHYLTLSATLRLPIPHRHATRGDLQCLAQRERELTFHPENFFATNNFLDQLPSEHQAVARHAIAQKQTWVNTPPTPANAAERHRVITNANVTLQPLLAHHWQQWQADRQQLQQAARATAILESRDYAFCLYPGDDLRQRLVRLACEAAPS